MAEDKITLRLNMVAIPEQPAQPKQPIYAAVSGRQMPQFNLGRFIQQSGILALIIMLSIGCYCVISRYFVETVQVVGVSMVPTLKPGNHYLLNRWAFHKRNPEQGEVVVITDPADKGVSVKRIVAVGGQSIYFKDGKVFIDGKELKEPYLAPNTFTDTYARAQEQFITCGKDQYFVLGDNRPKSIDSRSYGPVPRENILGLVVIR